MIVNIFLRFPSANFDYPDVIDELLFFILSGFQTWETTLRYGHRCPRIQPTR